MSKGGSVVMAKFLILYSTTDGHTGEIARRIRAQLVQAGHAPTLVDVRYPPDGFSLDGFDAAIVGASIHVEKYQRRIRRFVRAEAARLTRMPAAFFSVCMTAAGDSERERAHAQGYIDNFVAQTGWRPTRSTSFAGAVLYTQYGFFTRWLMRMFMKSRGRDTDTTRDWVYTDWWQVQKFVDAFLADLDLAGRQSRSA